MDWQNRELYNIRYTRLFFELRMDRECILPKNKVSALRGGIGEMMLRANCICDRNCESCGFVSECIVQRTMYSRFEKKPEFMQTGDSAGYVIECDNLNEQFEEGDTLTMVLLLFGKTIVYFNQYLQAIYALGRCGLGKGLATFSVINVKNIHGEAILDGNNIYMANYKISRVSDYIDYRLKKLDQAAGELENKLIFHTPLAMKYQGEILEEFNMDAILKGIRRRIYILDCFEDNCAEEAEEFYHAEIEAPEIIEQESRRISIRRFSSRKEEGMYLNGIKGFVKLDRITEEILPILLAGELIHIGKNTSFGFGKYWVK